MESRGIVGDAPAVSERAFGVRRVRRRPMSKRVTIGQTWRRRRGGGRTVRIRQVHRKDRVVDVVDGGGERLCLTFDELRRLWRQTDETAA